MLVQAIPLSVGVGSFTGGAGSTAAQTILSAKCQLLVWGNQHIGMHEMVERGSPTANKHVPTCGRGRATR
jgi:hypothetical protein